MSISHRLSISTAAFLIGLSSAPVLAQTAANDAPAVTSQTQVQTQAADTLQSNNVDRLVDRDLNQENQIEQGLKSGELTASEAARLERDESRVDWMESDALNNGQLSAAEDARLRRAQRETGDQITQLEDNNVTASGSSPSNTDLAADVQRNINQQQRIDNGLDNGSLTKAEAGSLEGGQAGVDKAEFRAGRNGDVTTAAQQAIKTGENTQGIDIRSDRHNGDVATTTDVGTTTVAEGNAGSMQDGDHRFDRDNPNHREMLTNGAQRIVIGQTTTLTGGTTNVQAGNSTSLMANSSIRSGPAVSDGHSVQVGPTVGTTNNTTTATEVTTGATTEVTTGATTNAAVQPVTTQPSVTPAPPVVPHMAPPMVPHVHH